MLSQKVISRTGQERRSPGISPLLVPEFFKQLREREREKRGIQRWRRLPASRKGVVWKERPSEPLDGGGSKSEKSQTKDEVEDHWSMLAGNISPMYSGTSNIRMIKNKGFELGLKIGT